MSQSELITDLSIYIIYSVASFHISLTFTYFRDVKGLGDTNKCLEQLTLQFKSFSLEFIGRHLTITFTLSAMLNDFLQHINKTCCQQYIII
jgi:hypothetical protein